jgi:hypothetical protein
MCTHTESLMLTVDVFLESIKSPATKEVYSNLLKAFTAKSGIKDIGFVTPEVATFDRHFCGAHDEHL